MRDADDRLTNETNRGRDGGATREAAHEDPPGIVTPAEDGAGAGEAADGQPASTPGAPDTPERERLLDEQREKYLRLAAEYENFRRRTRREGVEAATRAQADLVRQLLDPLDDLARFAHVDPSTVDAAAVVQGAELVERKLLKTLTAAGLEVLNPLDQSFDPALHEAVATEPARAREDDHVVARVFQPGYLFNGQLLRPARVVVKQWHG